MPSSCCRTDRVADAGDGEFRAQVLADQAAEHVDFIRGGGGDQDIGPIHFSLQQGRGVRAVAVDAHHVQIVFGFLDHNVILVNNGDVMLFAEEFFRQGMTDLAVADDQDPHVHSSNNAYMEFAVYKCIIAQIGLLANGFIHRHG